MATSDARRREIARLYAEQIVDAELGDVGETHKGSEPVEIDLLIITTAAHQELTARRTRERAGT